MIQFPPVTQATPSGLLCISEQMSVDLLWSAYCQGIFPWTDSPIGWFAPPERAVLLPKEATFPSNVRKLWRKARFEVTLDTCFLDVITQCRLVHQSEGEWITPRFVHHYTELSQAGHAHSVELWQDGALVGGTYGVLVGRVFSAESMFGRVDNASRSALYALVRLASTLQIECIDVQVLGDVTARLGAKNIPRHDFMQRLGEGLTPQAWRVPVSWPTSPFGVLAGAAP